MWAEECRRAQGLAISDPVALPAQIFTDRARVRPSEGKNVAVGNHSECITLPCKLMRDEQPLDFEVANCGPVGRATQVTPQGMPPKMVSDTHRGQVFYFSPENLRALKDEAGPHNATTDSTSNNGAGDRPRWISTNDAVTALLWRTVMAVQNPLESLGDANPTSAFAIAIDARSRFDPPVHPRTLGCFLAYVGVEMPIRRMLTGPPADIAIEIRRAVAKAGKGYAEELVAIADGLTDIDRFLIKAFADVPGYNCVQTSVSEGPPLFDRKIFMVLDEFD